MDRHTSSFRTLEENNPRPFLHRRAKYLQGRPHSTAGFRHMRKLGNKKSMIVELVTFYSDAVATFSLGIENVSMVNAKDHLRPLCGNKA